MSDPIKPHRGIYLLPNLFTTAALFAGFYAIIAAMSGQFNNAALAILIAMILDGLDGRVARMTNTQSDFGAEYDSLSDMVSFGLAPALVVYEWALVHIPGWSWANIGWLVAFLYTACGALRLARFNTQVGTADKRFFQGLASPAAAAIMVCMVWVGNDMGYSGEELSTLALVVTLFSGLLMVSRFPYYSFKDFNAKQKIPFMTLLAVVLIFVLTSIDPPKVIFLVMLAYALSGPLWSGYRWYRKRGRDVTESSDK
ncbi:MAG: CDP-diacylglycerol--serine O-phosphatidyltransferase [Gammaproteobacteria bacterium]|nr:CDP-diacylglycerol--serine O-phosphatidyltransferase [Gammaproteobacteria bacterium]